MSEMCNVKNWQTYPVCMEPRVFNGVSWTAWRDGNNFHLLLDELSIHCSLNLMLNVKKCCYCCCSMQRIRSLKIIKLRWCLILCTPKWINALKNMCASKSTYLDVMAAFPFYHINDACTLNVGRLVWCSYLQPT